MTTFTDEDSNSSTASSPRSVTSNASTMTLRSSDGELPEKQSLSSENDFIVQIDPEPQAQTLESVIQDMEDHAIVWSDEGDTVKTKSGKIRRKLLKGSYPSLTAQCEKKLSTVLRLAWKGKANKLANYICHKPKKWSKVNRQDGLGRSALHFAASWGDTRVLTVLLSIPGVNVELRDSNGMTPLFKALQLGSLECVKILIQAGANARARCKDNRTLLEYGIIDYGDERIEITKYLVKARGIRDTNLGDDRMTLLHMVTLAKANVPVYNTVELLLACGSDIEAVEGSGRTPLILAAMSDRADVVYTLLRTFADVLVVDRHGKNAKSYAKEGGRCYEMLQSCCDNTSTRVFRPPTCSW